MLTSHLQAKKTQTKRKRDDDVNELLPDKPPQEGDSYGSLDFHEVLDEEVRSLLWGLRPGHLDGMFYVRTPHASLSP